MKVEVNCVRCNAIITGYFKNLDVPRLCKSCSQIEVFTNCLACGALIKVKNLPAYYAGTYKPYCGPGCLLKYLHKQKDGVRYCEKCKTDTKHMLGIGCMTCYNKDENHKQSIINTVKNRYGEEYTNVYQVPVVKEKIVQTSLAKYGVTNPGNNRESRIKANNTRREHGFGSPCEEYFENALIELGIKYESQYMDDRYPFLCDFYLPDSDTFIELNIFWSHNKHYFDENNPDDLKILSRWSKKADAGHRQYQNAVNVWTKKDLIKRDVALKNNLNYVVLWTFSDAKDFINKLKESR